MRLSTRAGRLGESATLRVSRRVAELRAAGREVIDFGAGEPDFPSPPVAVEAARRALAEGFTRYTVAAGIPALRQALAESYQRRYGAPWGAANTLITVGAKSALFQLFLALVDEGDEVVLHSPSWVSFVEQVRFAGGTPVEVPTRDADGFAIRAAPLLEALTDRTRVVLVNSPCNPTGGVIAAEELATLAAACTERDAVLLCDETYERFLYNGGAHASGAALAAAHPQTVVVVGSFSKTYAMTGWRIGFALGAEPWIKKATAIQSHSTSNPTSFAMQGALAALGGAEAEVEKMIAEFARRRDYLIERLGALPGVTCAPPAGAFYAFPNVSALYQEGRRGSVAMAEHFLEAAGVAVVPGIAFGSDDHLRFSFACSWESLETGLDRLAAALGGT